ncbi:interleukin-1 beta [Salminus brasiliensis]|uniref:interleukin-1 beta n=1 Tax=Salminus brasiliensis TaxID=930266 RepID=UPI003B82D9B0
MANTDLLLLECSSEGDSAFESDEMDTDELDCSDPLAMSGRCDLHKGLRIEISEHPYSMRKVANIVIALQKLQKFRHTEKVQSMEFTEHELFSIVMESVVEETVVMKVSCDSLKTYNKQDRDIQCTVCDHLKKKLVHNEGDPYLLAVTLKGGNDSQSVRINLSAYTTPSCTATKGQPVCLGIANSNLYLSCIKSASGTPQLSLEEVKDKEALKTIYENDDMERFLFLRSVTGDSINTFESVKFPRWFICTSKEEYKPVQMCTEQDTSRQKVFSLLA